MAVHGHDKAQSSCKSGGNHERDDPRRCDRHRCACWSCIRRRRACTGKRWLEGRAAHLPVESRPTRCATKRSTFRSVSSPCSSSVCLDTIWKIMRGYRRESRSTTAETKLAASGGMLPIRTSPAVGSAKNSMFFTPRRKASNTAVPQSSSARPNSVGSTPLRSRSSKRTPNACSKSAIDLETLGCVVLRRCAAFPMLPA